MSFRLFLRIALFTTVFFSVQAADSCHSKDLKEMPLDLVHDFDQIIDEEILNGYGRKKDGLPNRPILFLSVLHKNAGLFNYFLPRTPKDKIDRANKKKETALHKAAITGQHEMVEKLIAAGANVAAATSQGESPLTLAAGRGHTKTVASLLRLGASINQHNVLVKPLHSAARNDKWETAELLLDKGAHKNELEVASGHTALDEALLYGAHDAALLFYDKGAQETCTHAAHKENMEKNLPRVREDFQQIQRLKKQFHNEAKKRKLANASLSESDEDAASCKVVPQQRPLFVYKGQLASNLKLSTSWISRPVVD